MPPLVYSCVMIVGLVRNCSRNIERDLSTLESSFGEARELKIFVVESDSSDDTIEVLEQLSKRKENFSFVSLGVLRDEIPKRTARIARCRNQYVEILRESPEYADIDYVVVADLDGVNNKLNGDAVRSCWDRDDWDVCAANQSGPYYDIWALRHRLWSPNDCWQQARFLRSYGVSHFKSVVASVHSRMVCIPPSSDWIEVESAFGGLAVYRKEVMDSVNYVGLTEDGKETCEHVAAHEQIRSSGGRIFVNPALINAGFVEHARNVSTYGLVRFWVRCQLRDIAFRLRLVSIIKKIRSITKNSG